MPPECACENYADRQIGHCGNASVGRDCTSSGPDGLEAAVGPANGKCQCNSTSAALSKKYVGAQPVYWPWPGGALAIGTALT